MLSQTRITGQSSAATDTVYPPELAAAHALMRQALALLDEFSLSAAAATLDMAIHQLDRELCEPRPE